MQIIIRKIIGENASDTSLLNSVFSSPTSTFLKFKTLKISKE